MALELRHEWLARGDRPLTRMKVALLGYDSVEGAMADTEASEWPSQRTARE